MILLLPFVALLGLAIGSFLNVVVYRVPAGRSLTPDSACPKCGTAIRRRDNIPVVSWLLLRGKCRGCHEPISARYPLVEAGTAVAFTLIALRFGPAAVEASTVPDAVAGWLTLAAFLTLTAFSIALALIDLDAHRLPDVLTMPALGAGVLLLGSAALLRGDVGALIAAAIGGVGLFLFYFLLAVVVPKGMGFGDVKLAAVLGLYLGFLGFGDLMVGAFAGFLLGGLFSAVLMITRRAGRKSKIPYGPWMILGAWVSIFVGGYVADMYFGAVGVV